MNEKKWKYYGDERKMGSNVHPVHVEFVAVPSYFEIDHYLSIREITGNFMSHEITLESVRLISGAIKEGPVFTLSSPTGSYAAATIFTIEIFKQAGLQIKSFSNFMPTDVRSYETILKHSTFSNRDGKPVIDMTFNFINLYKCVEEGVLEPVIAAVIAAEEYADGMSDTAEIYKS